MLSQLVVVLSSLSLFLCILFLAPLPSDGDVCPHHHHEAAAEAGAGFSSSCSSCQHQDNDPVGEVHDVVARCLRRPRADELSDGNDDEEDVPCIAAHYLAEPPRSTLLKGVLLPGGYGCTPATLRPLVAGGKEEEEEEEGGAPHDDPGVILALVLRGGGCGFAAKARSARAVGAEGLVIVDLPNSAPSPPSLMDAPSLNIIAVMIPHSTAWEEAATATPRVSSLLESMEIDWRTGGDEDAQRMSSLQAKFAEFSNSETSAVRRSVAQLSDGGGGVTMLSAAPSPSSVAFLWSLLLGLTESGIDPAAMTVVVAGNGDGSRLLLAECRLARERGLSGGGVDVSCLTTVNDGGDEVALPDPCSVVLLEPPPTAPAAEHFYRKHLSRATAASCEMVAVASSSSADERHIGNFFMATTTTDDAEERDFVMELVSHTVRGTTVWRRRDSGGGGVLPTGGTVGNCYCRYFLALAHTIAHHNSSSSSSSSSDAFIFDAGKSVMERGADDPLLLLCEKAPPRAIRSLPRVIALAGGDGAATADLVIDIKPLEAAKAALAAAVGGDPTRVDYRVHGGRDGSAWENDDGTKALFAMRGLIRVVASHALLGLLAAALPAEDEVVVHFRCSDVPFARHASYTLLRFEYYRLALESILSARKWPSPLLQVRVVGCFEHLVDHGGIADGRRNQDVCRGLAEALVEFLRTQRSVGGARLTCGESVDEDFLAMVQAPALVAGGIGSSMSFMAGVVSQSDGLTVVPGRTGAKSRQRRELADDFVVLDGGLRLPHEEVRSYYDLAEVLSHLSPS